MPPSRTLTGLGLAPALGLRAGSDGVFIVPQTAIQNEVMIMTVASWLLTLFSRVQSPHRQKPQQKRLTSCRPYLELLEDRTLLSAGDLDLTFGTGGKATFP